MSTGKRAMRAPADPTGVVVAARTVRVSTEQGKPAWATAWLATAPSTRDP